jgi:hypothetical protein
VYATILCKHSTPDRGVSDVSKELLDNLRELVGFLYFGHFFAFHGADYVWPLSRTLTKIERFAKKHASRNTFMGIIKHQSAIGTIQEFRESLRQSLDVFGVSFNN